MMSTKQEQELHEQQHTEHIVAGGWCRRAAPGSARGAPGERRGAAAAAAAAAGRRQAIQAIYLYTIHYSKYV
jgi:hypothetical protein